MPRFAVSWAGQIDKSLAVGTPADSLHWCWSRYRDEMLAGLVQVAVEEKDGVRLAQISFPVRIRREIEAENPAEAVLTFLHDDRVPDFVRVQDIEVDPVADPPTGPTGTVQ